MTPTQKQAIVVCILCALLILITASVTSVLVMSRVNQTPPEPPVTQVEPSSSGFSDYYQIDPAAQALLAETEDAGEAYLAETLFLGDSNTVRCYNSGLLTLQQYCAKEGMTLQNAMTEKFVPFKKDSKLYTMAEAVAMLKPRRVVITLGTNDTRMSVPDFISAYSSFVAQLQQSYPYADIIVNTIPPIPQNHASYPDMSQEKIDDFNMALVELCKQLGLKFLNSAEALKDESGYGKSEYYVDGDIHLKSSGLKALLNYVCTHAYTTEDRRPDTSNIPTRVQEYTNTPSAAVTPPPTPTPTATASSVQYQAYYQVDRGVGGTLTCGSDKGKTSLAYDITDASKSLTVTAVPASGYLFVKWSDGVTTMTRTDTNFKQNVNVTALFASASVSISGSSTASLGKPYTIKATLNGKYSTPERLHWYVNGKEVPEVAGKTTVTITVDQSLESQTYEIQAAILYNENKITSNTIKISVEAASQPPASGSTAGSGASSSGSTSSGASSGSGSSGDSSSGSASSGASSDSSSSGSSSLGASGSTSSSTPASSGSSSSGSASSGEQNASASASREQAASSGSDEASSASSAASSSSASSSPSASASSSTASSAAPVNEDPEDPAAWGAASSSSEA